MSHNYAGANVFPATIAMPDDGDPRNASSVNVPHEALADRTVYLKTRFDVLPNQIVSVVGSGLGNPSVFGDFTANGQIGGLAAISGAVVEIGDLIIVDTSFDVYYTGAANFCDVKLVSSSPTFVVEDRAFSNHTFSSSVLELPTSIHTVFTATEAGTYTIYLAAFGISNANTMRVIFAGVPIRVIVLRPVP
jgi:hypothetical protein